MYTNVEPEVESGTGEFTGESKISFLTVAWRTAGFKPFAALNLTLVAEVKMVVLSVRNRGPRSSLVEQYANDKAPALIVTPSPK